MLDYHKFKELNEMFAQGRSREARRILMELQARYIALCDEVQVLKKQVQEFEDIFFLAQNLVAEGQHYWLKTGPLKHGPFCRPCYDYIGKLIRLDGHMANWRCPYCGLLHKREGASRIDLAANSSPEAHKKIIPFAFPRKA